MPLGDAFPDPIMAAEAAAQQPGAHVRPSLLVRALDNALNSLFTRPIRLLQASEQLRAGEGYDPTPAVEQMTGMLGRGAIPRIASVGR